MKVRRYIPDLVLVAMAALVCVKPELGPSIAFLASACLWVLGRHPDEPPPAPPPVDNVRITALEAQMAAQTKQLETLKSSFNLSRIAR